MSTPFDSHAVVLSNTDGIPLETSNGVPLSAEKSGLLISGRDDLGNARHVNANTLGAVRTQPVASFGDTAQGFADLVAAGTVIVLAAVPGRRLYLTSMSVTSSLTLASVLTLQTTGAVSVHRWQLPLNIGPIPISIVSALRSGVGEGWQVNLSAFLAGTLSVNMAGFYADV